MSDRLFGYKFKDFGALCVAAIRPKGFLLMDSPLTVDEEQWRGWILLTGSTDLERCADISSVLAGRLGGLGSRSNRG